MYSSIYLRYAALDDILGSGVRLIVGQRKISQIQKCGYKATELPVPCHHSPFQKGNPTSLSARYTLSTTGQHKNYLARRAIPLGVIFSATTGLLLHSDILTSHLNLVKSCYQGYVRQGNTQRAVSIIIHKRYIA